MRIRFPNKEEEFLSSKDELFLYSQIMEDHLHLLKKQSNCGIFYWKVAGVFFVLCSVILLLKDRGLAISSSLFIFIVGLASLLMMLLNLKRDLKYSKQISLCVEKALKLEKTHKLLGSFQVFEKNKLFISRGNLINRLLPIGLICLSTGVSGIIFFLKYL